MSEPTLPQFLRARIAELRDAVDYAAIISPLELQLDCDSKLRIVEHCSAPPQCGSYEPPGSPDRAFYEEMRDKFGPHLPDDYSPYCDGCAAASSVSTSDGWILRYLAMPYASHRDFREEWRV